MITSHICRGNYHSTFFTSGPYDSVADYVFAQEHVDALLLEYDDARSGGFAPLAKVSPDKKVVLGLITTKKPELEDKDKVVQRNPHVYEGTYINVNRKKDGTLYPTFNRPQFTEKFTFQEFCLQAAKELWVISGQEKGQPINMK